jgi:hypothetical protein
MDPELCKFEDTNVGITLKLHNILVDKYGELNKYRYSNELKYFLFNEAIGWHDMNHSVK